MKTRFLSLFLSLLCICLSSQEKERGFIRPGDVLFENPFIEFPPFESERMSVFQDSQGIIWVGGGGFFRYDGYTLKNYVSIPVGEGDLSDTKISLIDEDLHGNIWIGHYGNNGIHRFDPRTEKFIHYPRPDIDPEQIEHSEITSILIDSKGRIWFGSYGYGNEAWGMGRGLFRYDYETDRFRHYFHNEENPSSLPYNTVNQLLEDKYGNIWLLSLGYELLRYDEESDSFIEYSLLLDNGDTASINSDILIEDGKGNLWTSGWEGDKDTDHAILYKISDDRSRILNAGNTVENCFDSVELFPTPFEEFILGVFYEENSADLFFSVQDFGFGSFNTMTHKWTFFTPDPDNPWSVSRAPILHEGNTYCDNLGGIWLANGNRFDYYFPEGQKIESYSGSFFGNVDESKNFIRSIIEDHEGMLWIATDNGILRYDPVSARKEWLGPDISGIELIMEDERGDVWLSTMNRLWNSKKNNEILYKFNRKSGKYDLIRNRKGIELDQRSLLIATMAVFTNPDQLWIGNRNNDKSLSVAERIDLFYEDIYNNARSEELIYGTVTSIEAGNSGEIWIATSLGLIYYNTHSGKVAYIENDPTNPKGLSASQLKSVLLDCNGNLWISTWAGYGLNMIRSEYMKYFDTTPDSLVFEYFSVENGLPDNMIFIILEDRHGKLWFSSREHITRYDPIGDEFISYLRDDDIEPHSKRKGILGKKSGKLFYASDDAMTVIDPDHIPENRYIPPVILTNLKINDISVSISDSTPLNQSIAYTDQIELRHDQNFISIEFASLNYFNPELNHYKFFMEGVDKDTVYAGTNRMAEYRDMNPGHYTFWVTGSNNDGIWNEEGISLDILIHPPWYRENLAYGTYMFLFILAIFGLIRLRTRSLERDKEKLARQVRERTREVESQKEELESTLENLKLTQAQLIQSEKLASLGGLVAGVAHEINTPVGIGVTAVSSLMEDTRHMAELYKQEQVSRKDFREFLQTTNNSARLIQKNLERTAQLVQSFKQVSTDQSVEENREFLLKEYIEDVLRSLYPKYKNRNIKINLECNEEIKVYANPGIFAQIFTNLVLNSLSHGFKGADHGQIDIIVNRVNHNLNIECRDNGRGIDEDILLRIFDPFFTTNKTIGTGLGLHIVYNLVTQNLKGTIECKSKINEGVVFNMAIPSDNTDG